MTTEREYLESYGQRTLKNCASLHRQPCAEGIIREWTIAS